MRTLVGVFRSWRAAEQAVNGLCAVGLRADSITFLAPGQPEEQLGSVPTTDAEADGMGKTLSGYVGGVVGGGAGLYLGSAIASLLVPGVGPIVAAGIGAAALLGIGGAAVGARIGEATEEKLDTGVPRDDVLFYRQLLKNGRSLVIASVDSDDAAAAVREALASHGAEDIDEARKEWRHRHPGEAA